MLGVISHDTQISAHPMHMVDVAMEIGMRIRRARKALGMGQAEMSRALGVTAVTALRWEKGKTVPPMERLRRIAELLRVSLEELMPPDLEIDATADEPTADDPEEQIHLAQLALAAAQSPGDKEAKQKLNEAILERARRLRAAMTRHVDEI